MTGVAARPNLAILRRWVADETWLKKALTARPWMSRAYFEARYLIPDPWHLASSGYERARAEASLRFLDGRRYASAVEVACGEGAFTAGLADRCDTVVAVDFSALAVRRARRRLADVPGVEVRQLDLRTDDLDRTFDLVFCAELFYYFSAGERDRVAARLAGWVAPGGDLCLGHGTSIHDAASGEPGVEWSGAISARGIHDRFRRMTGLTLIRELALPRYRLTLLRRTTARRG